MVNPFATIISLAGEPPIDQHREMVAKLVFRQTT